MLDSSDAQLTLQTLCANCKGHDTHVWTTDQN